MNWNHLTELKNRSICGVWSRHATCLFPPAIRSTNSFRVPKRRVRTTVCFRERTLLVPAKGRTDVRAYSSIGQSPRLITGLFLVRTQVGPREHKLGTSHARRLRHAGHACFDRSRPGGLGPDSDRITRTTRITRTKFATRAFGMSEVVSVVTVSDVRREGESG